MNARVELAPGAEENGFACMLSDLIRQNLEGSADKQKEFGKLVGRVALVVVDAEVAVTIEFEGGRATVKDGIRGVPHITVRGPADVIMALSSLPSSPVLGLPIPDRKNEDEVTSVKTVASALRKGELKVHGALLHLAIFARFSKVLGIH